MLISEVFGYAVDDRSEAAVANRSIKLCPFRGSTCTKASIKDPLGICSLSETGASAAVICPVRFLDRHQIFKDAAAVAFGSNVSFGVFPEIRILEIDDPENSGRIRKIGKIDFVLARIDAGRVTDFAALEVQSSYISGTSIRPGFEHFLATGKIDPVAADRRPDFRSSAQKRLFPQLQLKVPVFRRWGKKFFVVVDRLFFDELPVFKETTKSNSEITWLVYDLKKQGYAFELSDLRTSFTNWDTVQNTIREEGRSPEPDEIIAELQLKLSGPAAKTAKPIILST